MQNGGIANLLRVNEITVLCRMSGYYSEMSDQELDILVSDIKAQMTHIGYRLVMERLKSLGHRVHK